jgi:hypothetical protein
MEFMATDELTESNFKRINLINWLLTLPLLLLFSWPYMEFAKLFSLDRMIIVTGALIFAFPFLITILHGHVTMAIGALHRHLYYEWLEEHPLTWGLFFNSIMIRTRFRLLCIAASCMFLFLGFI